MDATHLSTITIEEFCQKYRINRASYYRNAKLGRMPRAIKVGGSTRILVSDEEHWLADRRGAGLQGGRS